MKKRKIFYFLKTKEEYDYMLANELIPKRGIVLIASTQEIYRDKIPYSGYGPLKTYFDQVKTDLQSLIQDKAEDTSSMVEQIDTKLQKDISDYNEQFQVKLNKLQTQISQNKTDLSSLKYYINNTLVPSLKETKDNTETLDNKYTQVLQEVNSNATIVNQFKSTLEGLISNIQEFKSTYNSELTGIRNSMLTISNTSSNDSISEAKVRNIVRELQLSDTEFANKVKTTVNPLLNSLKSEITALINARISEMSGTTGTGAGSSYQSATAYADSLFNRHASKSQFGTVKLGSYLKIDTNETVTIDTASLKSALNIGSGSSSSESVSDELDLIRSRLNLIESTINIEQLKRTIKNYIDAATITPTINWSEIYEQSGFVMSVKNVLISLNVLDPNGRYPLSSFGYTGTKNGFTFVNGLCTGAVDTTSNGGNINNIDNEGDISNDLEPLNPGLQPEPDNDVII